jgi:hypothetical protein
MRSIQQRAAIRTKSHLQSTSALIPQAEVLQFGQMPSLHKSGKNVVVRIKRAKVWERRNVQLLQSIAADAQYTQLWHRSRGIEIAQGVVI